MKLLCTSSDLGELEALVKRLVRIGIPCGVCKEPNSSRLSVWIQQDEDFPLALRIYANRPTPRRLPHWACLLDSAPAPIADAPAPPTPRPAPQAAKRSGTVGAVQVQAKGPTRTGTVTGTTLRRELQPS